MKLNLKKCVFRLQKGRFLGYVVNTSGIEANSYNVEEIKRRNA